MEACWSRRPRTRPSFNTIVTVLERILEVGGAGPKPDAQKLHLLTFYNCRAP